MQKPDKTANMPGTFSKEADLPRVKLPGLHQSAEHFLDWCRPLLTSAEYQETVTSVAEFLKSDSPSHTLYSALEAFDQRSDVYSWLDKFWQYRYLGRRDRIALNANFFFLFKETGEPSVHRAATLVDRAVAYKQALDSGQVPVHMQRGAPLSMRQHQFLFSTTRIPGDPLDTVRAPYTPEWPGPSSARHILVFRYGRMFRMDVLDVDGQQIPQRKIQSAIEIILAASETHAAVDMSVGHLTTKARAEWAESRQQLLSISPINGESLDSIERALFCLCLDDIQPQTTLEACNQLLRGNGGNRWFDKSLSLVVMEDGNAGINIEHCELDGTTALSLVDSLMETPTNPSNSLGQDNDSSPTLISPVEFVLNDALRKDIREAATEFSHYAASMTSTTVSLDTFGANRAKQLHVSPDALVQLAFQLAHYRAKGFIGPTYESIATRQYRHGRTEAMRVVTPEILQFVTAMESRDTSDKECCSALMAAAKAHVARAKSCQMGDAPEQLLWELQLIQQRDGKRLGAHRPLALYDSPGWLTMRTDALSTSSAPSEHIQHFGFGSTSETCIGVGYVLLPGSLRIYLSTANTVASEMDAFAESIPKALDELCNLLQP